MSKSAQPAAPANGTGSEPQPETPVSGINLGQLLDEQGLTNLINEKFLNEGETQAADSPAPKEGETEPNQPASEPAASAEDAVEEAADTTDLSQSENTEEAEDDAPDISDGVKKRFAKLTAKRREAEDALRQTQSQLEQLREEMESLKSKREPIPPTTAENPFSGLTQQEDVDREIAQARKVRRWCEENPDGAVVTDASGKEVEYTAEQIRKIKLNAVDALEEHLPKQLHYIRESSKWHQTAEQIYPWWKDRSNQNRILAEQYLAQAPELKRFPNYKLFLGDYILGVAYREAQAKAAGKKNAPVKKAPVQPSKPAQPTTSKDDKSDKARSSIESFRKTGSEKDLMNAVLNNYV